MHAPQRGIFDRIDVHRAGIRQVEEDVLCVDGGSAALLVTEDEVDPLVEVRGDVVGF